MVRCLLLAMVVLALIHSLPVSGNVVINEIFYNAPGSDNNKEFVELYAHNMPLLVDFTIMDASSEDTLLPIRLTNSSYALIVEDGFIYDNISASIYSAGATIGNNLDNSGDILTLFTPQGNIVTTEIYNSTYANGNGFSLERINDIFLESLVVGGTPGKPNSALVPTNHKCSLQILTPKQIIDKNDKLTFSFRTNTNNFIIVYWIEDLFGTILKNKINTTNTNKKSYTPKLDESQNEKTLVIKSTLNTNFCNTSASELVVVIGKEQNCSSLSIDEINLGADEKARFGETLAVELSFCTTKTNQKINLWLEDKENKISQDSSIKLTDHFTQGTIKFPISIKPNCNHKFEPKTYSLIAKGFNKETTRSVIVDENLDCLKTKINPKQTRKQLKYFHTNSISQTNNSFNITTILENENKPHNFTISSYIYRGSKKYAQTQPNTIMLDSEEHEIITHNLNISNIPSGDYKLRTRILKDNLKTPYYLTQNLTIHKPKKKQPAKITTLATKALNLSRNSTTFLSKGLKVYSKAPYIIAFFALFSTSIMAFRGPREAIFHKIR